MCRGSGREGSCEGREETELLLWIERGRQGGDNLKKLETNSQFRSEN